MDAAAGEQGAGAAHLVQDSLDELLAAEPRIDAHHQDQVELVQHRLDRGDRGARVERHARALAERADGLQAAMQVRARLGMDGDQVGAGARERLEVRLVRRDHQMHVERLGRQRPQRTHHFRTEAEIGHEVAVHDVQMDPVGAGGVERAHLLAEAREVGGRIDGAISTRSLMTGPALVGEPT